jgi:hypothetical protein
VSYDLSIRPVGPTLDLAAARVAFVARAEGEGDELVWESDALSASILLTEAEIGIGVTGDDVPTADRAREFEALLVAVLDAAEQAGGRVTDPQLGRALGRADVAAAVAEFA